MFIVEKIRKLDLKNLDCQSLRGLYPEYYTVPVHDCLDMENEAKTYSVMLKQGTLQPGNIITIEPGIYFNERILNDQEKVEEFSGLVDFEKARGLMATVSGIRIEDDVLVTETGSRVLGPGIPEERDELEKIVGAGGLRFFE